MRLFVDMQRLSEAGTRLKVSVPASKALVMTNKTKAPVLVYADQSSKVGYPLEIQESLEIETITETCDFFIEISDTQIEGTEGLYIVSQSEMGDIYKRTTNNVVINQD